jgi:hypothetical protein
MRELIAGLRRGRRRAGVSKTSRTEIWLAVLKDCPVSPDDVPRRRRAPARRRELSAGRLTDFDKPRRRDYAAGQRARSMIVAGS